MKEPFTSHAEADEGERDVWLSVAPARQKLLKVELESNGESLWTEVSSPELFRYLVGIELPPVDIARARSPLGPQTFVSGNARVTRRRQSVDGEWITTVETAYADPRPLAACLLAAHQEAALAVGR